MILLFVLKARLSIIIFLMILLFILKARLSSFVFLLNSCFLKIYTRFYRKHIFIFTRFMATFITLLRTTAIIVRVRYSIR